MNNTKSILIIYDPYNDRFSKSKVEINDLDDAIRVADRSISNECWFGYYEKYDTHCYGLKKVFTGRFPKGSNPFLGMNRIQVFYDEDDTYTKKFRMVF
jgi:hypothetical protein